MRKVGANFGLLSEEHLLNLVMGNLCFRAESEHIMQGAFIQMGQAVGRKINQKIRTFKGGHFYLPIGGQMS